MNRIWKKELQECKEYFKVNPVMERLLEGFKNKYTSLGKVGGTVVLGKLTEEDIETLEGFFRKNFHGKKSIGISAKSLQESLDKSRFAGITPEELLRYYFHDNLKSKKEIRYDEEQQRENDFLEIAMSFSGKIAGFWLENVMKEKGSTWQLLVRLYKTDKCKMQELLRNVMNACEQLPYQEEAFEYLAVFAAKVTGDPHYFDEGCDGGSILYSMLIWVCNYLDSELNSKVESNSKQESKSDGSRLPEVTLQEKTIRQAVFPAIQKQKIYLQTGILKDDISNYTTVCGIRAWKPDGLIHQGAEGFFQEGETMQVTLSVLAGWQRVESISSKIYIVENPSVYGVLASKTRGRCSLMCMSGQPKLASVLLLDKLALAGTHIYYAGDFDPEGLWIALRLKKYYGDKLHFWHMDSDCYDKVMSTKTISEKRLKLLERITDGELQATADKMKKLQMAGYQEGLLDMYLWDLYEIG